MGLDVQGRVGARSGSGDGDAVGFFVSTLRQDCVGCGRVLVRGFALRPSKLRGSLRLLPEGDIAFNIPQSAKVA